MEIKFNCPVCHKLIALDETCHGRKVQCPYCRNVFVANIANPLQSNKQGQAIVKSMGPTQGVGTDPAPTKIPATHEHVRGNPPLDSAAGLQKRIISCALTLIFAVVVLLWIGGCIAGCSDASEGQNLIGYTMRKNNMNFISGSGYAFYFNNFTDIKVKRKEINDALNGW